MTPEQDETYSEAATSGRLLEWMNRHPQSPLPHERPEDWRVGKQMELFEGMAA
jgi:hypothetical protein